jgi:peroxiredoxin
MSFLDLPPDLPRPTDDGAAAHLPGRPVPSIPLPATSGGPIDLAHVGPRPIVLYIYPMTGRPGVPLPDGWDLIPGARGCTPQTCGFRDAYQELRALGVDVMGLSTQDTDYQREMVTRLHVPFPILSDAAFHFADALQLPRFTVGGRVLLKRLTLILRAGRIEHVFYPVFPPNESAAVVLQWLRTQGRPATA